MSSVSDETDLLLLIPPDFFMANPSSCMSPGTEVGSSVSAQGYHNHRFRPTVADSSSLARDRPSAAEYSFQSSSLHRDDAWTTGNKLIHSTPKVDDTKSTEKWPRNGVGDPVIREIDRYLQNSAGSENKHFRERSPNSRETEEDTLNAFSGKCSMGEGSRNSPKFRRKLILSGVVDEPLMSLSTMWGRDNKSPDISMGGQEERMRRKHCEQTIQVLQQKVLEFEQKIAVAIKVDRRKDEVLAAMKESNAKLTKQVDTLEHALDKANHRLNTNQQKYETDEANLKRSMDSLQSELNRTLVSNRHLNECNELLEKKIAHVTRTTSEIRSSHQQQIGELEVRLSNAAKTEEILNAEVAKWKSVAAKLKSDEASGEEFEALKVRAQQLEADNLRQDQNIRDHRRKVDSLQAKEVGLGLQSFKCYPNFTNVS